MKIKINISGGYHNSKGINIMVDADVLAEATKCDGRPDWHYILDSLSPVQRRKLNNAMCGIDGCMCAPHHGWELEVNP